MPNRKKHIVLLAYYFPPLNHVAGRRAYAFYNYLSKEKYEVTVLTTANSSHSDVLHVNQNAGLRLRNTTGKSFLKNKLNAAYNKLYLRLFLDENKHWTKELKKNLDVLHAKKPIDVLISSFAPLSTLLAGYDFVKNNSDVKWVMDMRDEFSTSPFISSGRKSKLEKLEAKFLGRANAVLSVSKPIVDIFKNIGDKLNSNLICEEIRNGFDFEIDTSCVNHRNEKFSISYLGSFYASRKPDNFFKALQQLIEEGVISKDEVLVNIWSSVKSYFVPSFLNGVIQHYSGISEKDSIIKMQQSDVLLLVHPANGAKGVFTGKLFEYLGSCRPVLGLIDPDDVAAQLINELNAGWVAPNEDISLIKEKIKEAYLCWKNATEYNPDIEGIRMLHRAYQVKKFEDNVIDKLLNE